MSFVVQSVLLKRLAPVCLSYCLCTFMADLCSVRFLGNDLGMQDEMISKGSLSRQNLSPRRVSLVAKMSMIIHAMPTALVTWL